jgi:hypothetical protein
MKTAENRIQGLREKERRGLVNNDYIIGIRSG